MAEVFKNFLSPLLPITLPIVAIRFFHDQLDLTALNPAKSSVPATRYRENKSLSD